MPCYPFKLGETTGIICAEKPRVRKCVKCGKPHERLCDYPKAKKDCDAPLCLACSHSLWRSQHRDSLDYCPQHAPFVWFIGENPLVAINKHAVKETREGVFLYNVMRPTPLGNPFTLADNATDSDREECLQKYKRWLWERMNTDGSDQKAALWFIITQIRKQPVWLQCCCAPKACHAQVIGNAIQWMTKQTV